MKKNKLEKFIDLYHLASGGDDKIDKVKISINDKIAEVKLSSEDKTVIGSVTMDGFEYTTDDNKTNGIELAISNTTDLIRLLNPYDSEIEIEIAKHKNRNSYQFIKFKNVSDFKITGEYMLAEPEVIPKAGALKSTINFEIEIPLTNDIVNKMISLKNSIDSDIFTFVSDKNDKIKLIMGYSSTTASSNNNISLDAIYNTQIDLPHKAFNASKLKTILSVNKGFTEGKLKIYSGGLINLSFTHDKDLKSEYYLVQLKIS